MNPEDPGKKIMDILLHVAGVCMRLTGNRYNAKEAAKIIQRMMDNVDILVMQMETKCKWLQTSLNKTNRLKNELYNQVQDLKRKKNFCEICNSTIEESFADEKDSMMTSSQIMQTLPAPMPGSPKLASTPSPEWESTPKRSQSSLPT